MTRPESLRFRVSWMALLVTGLATFAFGVVVLFMRGTDEQYLRAIGAASIGMGLFGFFSPPTHVLSVEEELDVEDEGFAPTHPHATGEC
jgi:hypothetical protein